MEIPTQVHHKHMLQSEEVTQKSIFVNITFSLCPHLSPWRKVISTPIPSAAIQEAKELQVVS